MIRNKYAWINVDDLASTALTRYVPVPKNAPALKPCPCCGGEAEYRSLHSVWVACKVCGLTTPGSLNVDILATTWNGNIGVMDSTGTKYLEGVERDDPEIDPVATASTDQSTP